MTFFQENFGSEASNGEECMELVFAAFSIFQFVVIVVVKVVKFYFDAMPL